MCETGTWEHAAVSTFHDAHNQLGLNLLSYAMERQKDAKRHGDLLVLVDRLFVAADLMLACVHSIDLMVESSAPLLSGGSSVKVDYSSARYSQGHAPLSTPFLHLLKNAALCLMRLESLLAVGVKFRDKMQDIVESKDPAAVEFQVYIICPLLGHPLCALHNYHLSGALTVSSSLLAALCVCDQKQLLLQGDYLVSKLTGDVLQRVRQQAMEAIQNFLNIAERDDKDVLAFQKSLKILRDSGVQ